MKKVIGITILFLAACAYTAYASDSFLTPYNLENVIRRTALTGIIGIGAAFVIITRGIDLSIGSVLALVGTLLPWMLVHHQYSVATSLTTVIVISAFIGLAHGLLITKLKLQPFVVTLCGLLIYRGLARYLVDDDVQGFGSGYANLRYLATGVPFYIYMPGAGRVGVPMPFILMLVIALIAAVFLNLTVYGRYLLALGRNSEAARFSGINTDRMEILAYVICATLAGLGGVLFALEVNSVQPSIHGNFYELYAIAAAVIGGCSLRGGEGSIAGVVVGAALMRAILPNMINLLGIRSQLEFPIIGAVILTGVIVDEVIKRTVAARRAARLAQTRGERSAAPPTAVADAG